MAGPITVAGVDTELIGRATELAAIAAAVESSTLVTLIGPAGTGKTSLARAVAALAIRDASSTRFRRSVTVDLASIGEPTAVPSLVAEQLGAREGRDPDVEAAIVSRLTAEPTLLVLDNAEHLLASAPFVRRLSEQAGPSRVLVTSRTALRVSGELIVRIEPLRTPAASEDVATAPASELFLRRAGRTAASYAPSDLEAIAAACRRLDGLPLAIELAAAWGTVLTPRAILRRLETERLPLGSPGGDRHASLDSVIESSLALLDETDRNGFDRLAVFVGPFDDEAATAVIGDGSLSVLRSLASLSLVQVAAAADGEPRFRLLETVRAAAHRRLDLHTAEAHTAGMAHARHFERRSATAADHLRHQMFGDPGATDSLQDPNNLAALEFALATRDAPLAVALATWPLTLAVRTGLLSAPLRRLEQALALGPVPAGIRSDALNSLVSVRLGRGDRGLLDLAKAAVDAARESGDERRVARTLVTLGHTLPASEAIATYQDAMIAAEAVGYAWMVANANLNIAWRHHQAGRFEDAIVSSEGGLRAATEAGSLQTAANARTNMADAWLALGDDAAAAAAYEQALPTLRHVAPVQFVTGPLCSLAVIAMRAGDDDLALTYLEEIVALVGDSESVDAVNDVALASALVLASTHPMVASRALGLLDADLIPAQFATDLERIEAIVERRLGRRPVQRAMHAGRIAGRRALADEVRRIVGLEGPEATRRLRATYETFTGREEQVLHRLAEGRSDPEIAAELGMSTKTASVHVANIKAKLGLSTRVEAALAARRLLDGVGPGSGPPAA